MPPAMQPAPPPLAPLALGLAALAAGGLVLWARLRRSAPEPPVPAAAEPPAPAVPAPPVPTAPPAVSTVHQIGAVQVEQEGPWLRWTSGFRVDADGDPRAYHPDDWGPRRPGRAFLGLDAPENAGRPKDPARPGAGTWYGVVATGPAGAQVPAVQDGHGPAQPAAGYWISKTALVNPSYPAGDVRRYVSASAVPYIAVPPELLKLGVKLGDLARVSRGSASSLAIVADVSGAGRLGEGSILLAQRLGIPSDPRGGGVSAGVRWEVRAGSGLGRPLSAEEIDQSTAAAS